MIDQLAKPLQIENLSKRYLEGNLALENLNLEVNTGEVVIVLGPNGAGKTTTINLILGFTEPTSGIIKILGIDMAKNPLQAKEKVAYVSENVMLYPTFTAMQNLRFFTQLAGFDAEGGKLEQTLTRVGLPVDSFRMKVGNFSKGMRQRLGIAIAITRQAKLILLDEPTSGLDPRGGEEFLELLRELKAEDKSILMTTHDTLRASKIADRIIIMNHGKIVFEAKGQDITTEEIIKIYLESVDK
jgi:ABC-2 type transport system ATP-binding protein